MKWVSLAIAMTLIMLNFQNCAPSHISPNAFSIASIYPYYDEKPEYFDSVQLIDSNESGGTWTYKFAASVVYADNPAMDIDVEIAIVDEAGTALCPVTQLTVNQTSNNIIIDNCQATHQATQAKITIQAKLHSDTAGTVQPVSEYTFDL
jgi:hypothetical protein